MTGVQCVLACTIPYVTQRRCFLSMTRTHCANKDNVVNEELRSTSDKSFMEKLRRNPIAAVLEKTVEPNRGYEMALFPLIRKVESDALAPDEITEERRQALRNQAARELKNIDVPEQRRRKIFGTSILIIVLAIDAYLVLEKYGFWARFATTPLLCLGLAYMASGQIGICNIAQKGMWQVDGTGLKTIDDQELAKQLLTKVNKFNAASIVISISISLVFSLYPLN